MSPCASADYQPYCYVKQKTRVNASLRVVGCELEDINVQLLRQGQVVQIEEAQRATASGNSG